MSNLRIPILLKICITSFFLLPNIITNSSLLYAQADNFDQHEIKVNISPLSYLAYRPRVRCGLEYARKNWAVVMEVEAGNYAMNAPIVNFFNWDESYKYFGLRPQLNIYFSEGVAQGFYGIELIYSHMRNTFYNQYFYPEDATDENPFKIDYESANFNRVKVGIHIMNGFDFSINRTFEIGVNYGLGYAVRNNYYRELENPVRTPASEIEDGLDINLGLFGSQSYIKRVTHRKSGYKHLFDFTFNLSLKFVFWRF